MRTTILVAVLLACGLALADQPVTRLTRKTADPVKDPSYRSVRVEAQTFSGCFVPVQAWRPIQFKLISDDGCDLVVDGKLLVHRFRMPQHMPNKAQSVRFATGTYGPWKHLIVVRYSNIIYIPEFGEAAHRDGATLQAPGVRFVPCGPRRDWEREYKEKQERARLEKERERMEADRQKLLDQLEKDKKKDEDAKPKGNNGVGNGEDPQPPGNPPVNDGPGTSPGNPGNKKDK